MERNSDCPNKARRAWLTLAVVPTIFWAGCATSPLSLNEGQRAALNELGFSKKDEGWELQLESRMLFAVDDASLNAKDLEAISGVAQTLLAVGIDRLIVEGHTDNTGSETHNKLLAERRAAVVADALIKRGFAPQNIIRRAYGASRPIADNSTEAGRRHNRRAVLIVSSY